jgi:DNA-binding response OmpR family regulator
VVTYQELQDMIWQNDVMTDSALRSLVRNLRKKLPTDFITNLSGVGYKLVLV